MNKRLFIAALAVWDSAVMGCRQPKQAAKQPQRPNIIFIMSDDHSQRAISAYGCLLIRTSNIVGVIRSCTT
ncbi:hypothetical protein KO507_03080 [Gilvimarinus agarilyticus]|uniref:hypothetical protein n=1 Tax=Reichenbachiella agariperforans TaxID=156994 RepID=UPI001C086125|nr:hypothetical protein [Reichenbachiella agariperforans]MBU2884744.1 hypothetical protein [Gilvimarinus agarilyticus]MBU2914934.1 hypothetical protein [Reichenbachiella agariperforans]